MRLSRRLKSLVHGYTNQDQNTGILTTDPKQPIILSLRYLNDPNSKRSILLSLNIQKISKRHSQVLQVNSKIFGGIYGAPSFGSSHLVPEIPAFGNSCSRQL